MTCKLVLPWCSLVLPSNQWCGRSLACTGSSPTFTARRPCTWPRTAARPGNPRTKWWIVQLATFDYRRVHRYDDKCVTNRHVEIDWHDVYLDKCVTAGAERMRTIHLIRLDEMRLSYVDCKLICAAVRILSASPPPQKKVTWYQMILILLIPCTFQKPGAIQKLGLRQEWPRSQFTTLIGMKSPHWSSSFDLFIHHCYIWRWVKLGKPKAGPVYWWTPNSYMLTMNVGSVKFQV